MAKKKGISSKRVARRKPTPAQEAKSESTSARRLAELAEESTVMARLVARNPSAPERVLEKLGSHPDATVRKWVTAHPGTPPSVLIRLATQFPEQLLDNPVFDILLLENPNLLNELPVGTRRSLLKREKCPLTFLVWLAEDDDEGVQLALAMNPNTPRHILEKLEKSQSKKVRASVKQHFNWPKARSTRRDLTLELSEALDAEPPNDKVQEKIRFLSPWAAALQGDNDALRRQLVDWVRWRMNAEALAHDTRTPPHILAKLGNDPSWLVRRWVGSNSSTDSLTLERLASDPSEAVRMHVATNESTPANVLDQLGRERALSVRKLVAFNPSTPEQTIRCLARSSDFEILAAIAVHPETPVDVLSELLERKSDEDRWDHQSIRRKIASQVKLPGRVLADLCGDPASDVREAAIRNRSTPRAFRMEHQYANSDDPELLQFLAQSHLLGTRIAVAANPKTPEAVLRALAGKTAIEPEVLVAIAKNPSTPPDLLNKLGRSRNSDVRVAVATNPAMPASLLESLVRRWPHDARLTTASNPDVPLSVLSFLAKRASGVAWNRFNVKAYEAVHEAAAIAGNVNTSPATLDSFFSASEPFLQSVESRESASAWSGPNCWKLMEALAENIRSTPKILSALAKVQVLEIRLQVAQNPAAPREVLSALSKDRSARVARAANSNLASAGPTEGRPQENSRTRRAQASPRKITDRDRLMAELPGLASQLGSRWLAHPRATVRRHLAKNPALSEDVAMGLAQDSNQGVRTALAENACVPESVLGVLLKDKNKKVAGIAARRLSNAAPDSELLAKDRRMATRILKAESRGPASIDWNPWWRASEFSEADQLTQRLSKLKAAVGSKDEELKTLVKGFADDIGRSSRPSFQRLMCLLMAECPTSLLAKSARSTDWKERLAIASHPKTPPAIRKQLANDGNGFVRAAAGAAMATVAK